MSNDSLLVLFSGVTGTVLKDGEPVQGAEVVQKVLYKTTDEILEVKVKTAADGRFSFDEVSVPKPRKWLPGEVTITQSLVIVVDGIQYEGWHHGKKGDEANSELDGRALKLVCDLATEPGVEGNHYGICREAKD